MSIDRAEWHYSGDYPEGLPQENASTHIGMFLAWIIINDLVSQEHLDNLKPELDKVKQRQITGRDFFINQCDEKFWESDLNENGLSFTKVYYDDGDPENTFGDFIDDYVDVFEDIDCETIYEIPNT